MHVRYKRVTPDDPTPVPLERLEAQSCELAGHLTAATCRFLVLLKDFERGYLIAARPGGTFAFWRPDGTALPPSPPLPEPAGAIGDCHEAEITEDTIIPPWYGERLDLDHAIYTCLANARTPEERQAQREQGQGHARDRVQVFEPEGWSDRIRQYYAEHPIRQYYYAA